LDNGQSKLKLRKLLAELKERSWGGLQLGRVDQEAGMGSAAAAAAVQLSEVQQNRCRELQSIHRLNLVRSAQRQPQRAQSYQVLLPVPVLVFVILVFAVVVFVFMTAVNRTE
jgi:hypothetical protein